MKYLCSLPLVSLSLLVFWACSDGPVTVAEPGTSAGAGGAPNSTSSGGAAGAGESGGNAGGTSTSTTSTATGTTSTGTTSAPPGLGVGADCSEAMCRAGLVCEADICELGGSTELGSPCVVSGECVEGLVCVAGACAPAGTGEVDDACQSDLDCGSGLRCTLLGFSASCQPEGSGDLGQSCAVSGECMGGLACIAGACALPPTGLPPFGPPLPAVECEPPNDTNVRAFFEVPGAADAEEGDFFRLPFPNDVRLTDGTLDLSGFPTPGSGLLGVDPVQLYLDRIAASHTGWGTEPKVIFRFSGRIDHTSFTDDQAKLEGRVRVVDVTPNLSEAELDPNAGWQIIYNTGRTNYVCDHWFGMSRPLGTPMRAGHTYAFILTTGGTDFGGNPIARSANLGALLADDAPSDAALSDAYAAYAPLRAYLASDNGDDSGRIDLDADDVLNASVVTVADHQATMRALAQAVESEFTSSAPLVSDWVLCDTGVESPCPEREGDRGCQAANPDYDEYHALVTLPVFQEGEAPYQIEGGAIDTSGPVRSEQVCMSLTVPAGGAPQAGYPLVIFAHGTGGSFRSHVSDAVAGALANASEPFAVLGIDQVEHGPRRGGSDESPDDLFFNFLNPDAALGNPLQGAADQLSLLKLAETLNVTADETGGEAIQIDPTKIVFFGHSQGSTHGSLMLPYASLPGAVLSGNGGGLRYSLLSKTEPVNIAGALPFVLGDPAADGTLAMGEWHPALSILQQWIDGADPYNFAEAAGVRPEAGGIAHHIFETYGIDDSYAPPTTLFAYGLAARAQMAPLPAGVDPDETNSHNRLVPEVAPISGNRFVGVDTITIAMRQYAPPTGVDGHFVVFSDATANADVVEFLSALAAGSVPSVPAP